MPLWDLLFGLDLMSTSGTLTYCFGDTKISGPGLNFSSTSLRPMTEFPGLNFHPLQFTPQKNVLDATNKLFPKTSLVHNEVSLFFIKQCIIPLLVPLHQTFSFRTDDEG